MAFYASGHMEEQRTGKKTTICAPREKAERGKFWAKYMREVEHEIYAFSNLPGGRQQHLL